MATISLHSWSGSASTLGSGYVVGEDVTFGEDVRLAAVGFQAGDTATATRIGVAVWDGTTLLASSYKTNQSISAGTYYDVAFGAAPVLEAGKTYRAAVYVEASGYFPHGMYTARGGTHSHSGGGFTATLGETSFYATSGPETVRPTTTYSYEASHRYQVEAANVAPNAPTLTTLVGGEVIDRAAVNRAAHSFSDPDAGDSQSAFDHRYRLVGAATWTEAYVVSPNSFVDYPAGTFAAGDYERQVRTYDAQGVVGPWSASGFFTAATAPATPTIMAPTNGATVSNSETVTWSNPSQASYQLRRVADNAGAPDTGTIYEDSGEVVSTTARSRAVTFATNNRFEHVQVRIKDNGLWSAWASVRVQVSWTPPPTPVVSLLADDDAGSLIVTVTNPAPGAGEPAAAYNDIFVDDGNGEFRAATMVTPNTSWTYRLPVSGRDYAGSVRVEAVADNGITASS